MNLPIILLHGLNFPPESLNFIKKFLKDNKVFIISYEIKNKSIEQIVNSIIIKIKFENFILIGHSLGGILGYHVALKRKVKLLITIGSPVRGEYRYKKIITNPLDIPKCDYHCITMAKLFYTQFDGIVYEKECYFDDKFHTHICNCDHKKVLNDQRLLKILLKILQRSKL